jgi:hypothetical protein
MVYLVFWLNETNQMNQINQINKTNKINQTTPVSARPSWGDSSSIDRFRRWVFGRLYLVLDDSGTDG